MFDNIGGKIKGLAEALAWMGIAGSLIAGLLIMINGASLETAYSGLIIIVAGCLGSWLSSFILYGFGQLIENSDKIVKAIVPKPEKPVQPVNVYQAKKRDDVDYLTTDWNSRIRELSNDELRERIQSEDWEDDYKKMCQEELDRRKLLKNA